MTEEEIRSRILICEIRERDYREVGNAKTAERYRNEIYKWEELLDKINPKNYEDLQKYKYGYIRLEKENQQLKEQQKEFIDYLEKEIVDSRAGSSQYYSAIQHLKLFKEIIGSDKQ